jgi:hypothetical protein
MASTAVIDRTNAMSPKDKVGEAMRRSISILPADAGQVVSLMLQPESLAILTGTLVVWAGSHFFGVGEIVDAVLLVVGAFTLGFGVFDGAKELYDFATIATKAQSDQELDVASKHFARAVTVLGMAAIQAVLLRGQAQTIFARGRPQVYPRIQVNEPPATSGLNVTRPASIAGGYLGTTNEYGVIVVSRAQSLSEQQLTLYHELVHRFFSPRMGPFLKLRAELNISAYSRSALLKYLEEALAEGYSQLRFNGLASALYALRFPLRCGYVTVSQLISEGTALGTIVLGGSIFKVSVSNGPVPQK